LKYRFFESTALPEKFFEILPDDWKEAIVPYWPEYKNTTRIFVLETKGKIIGGGLVFSVVSPDTVFYKQEAQSWFDKGYLYLAYIWIDPQFRGKGLGSEWLKQTHTFYNGRKFWLAIEDYKLVKFYSLNGYSLVKEIQGEDSLEWIMAKHSN